MPSMTVSSSRRPAMTATLCWVPGLPDHFPGYCSHGDDGTWLATGEIPYCGLFVKGKISPAKIYL